MSIAATKRTTFLTLIVCACYAAAEPALGNTEGTQVNAPIETEEVLETELMFDENTPVFQTIGDFEQAVVAAEAEYGAYGKELAEHLLALGKALHRADQHDEALDVLRRAWHLVRINQGLYNLKQLPILDLMVQSQAALKDWTSVGDSYDFVHWVYRRNYTADDPRLLPLLKKLRVWHISAYYVDSGRTLTEHFYAADAIYKQAVNIIETQTGDPMKAMCFWHEACCGETDAQLIKQCTISSRARPGIPADALRRPNDGSEHATPGH